MRVRTVTIVVLLSLLAGASGACASSSSAADAQPISALPTAEPAGSTTPTSCDQVARGFLELMLQIDGLDPSDTAAVTQMLDRSAELNETLADSGCDPIAVTRQVCGGIEGWAVPASVAAECKRAAL